MILRPYQTKASDLIFKEWEENSSTLLVMPTGTGKTIVIGDVIRRLQPKRTMFLAHRAELIFQAKTRLEDFDIQSDIEMADFHAGTTFWNRERVVVATVQTLASGTNGGRKMRFDPKDFGAVICDEAHHFTSPQFRSAIEYFRQNPDIKILGVTATPDRADEEALGQVFQSVAFDYEILDAIHDGWLVPVEQQMVHVNDLDYSQIRTTAGDLNGADLAEVMERERNLQGVAGATIQIIGNKKTIVFAASLVQAERLAEIFNRNRDGMAKFVSGFTPKDQRATILSDFKKGTTQVIVNVGVLTEGYDEPSVEVIVMARPTKSRSLYSQMIGRSTRPLPDIVDRYDTPEERRFAIETSLKPCCKIVDFVGNSGRHKLITTADILGGNVSDEAIELAKERLQTGTPRRTSEVLDEAIKEIEERKQREAARRLKLVAKAKYSSTLIDPFNVFDMAPAIERGWDKGKHLSEKQKDLLRKQGIDPDKYTYTQGKQLINNFFYRWNNKLSSMKQIALLKKFGVNGNDMTHKEASVLIDKIAKSGWSRKRDWNAEVAQG